MGVRPAYTLLLTADCASSMQCLFTALQHCQGLVMSMHGVQVKELLLPFGSLKAFNLVMDKNTGNSKVSPQKLMSSALPNSEALVER